MKHRNGNLELAVEDLMASTASCCASDPGPDPTWDPDELPQDDESITS